MVLTSQTSIVFSLEEGPGVLFKALAVFALRQINLTKVCSLLPYSLYGIFLLFHILVYVQAVLMPYFLPD